MKDPSTQESTGHDTRSLPIVAEKVSASYGGKLVLQELTFEIRAGEQVALVGPNGAGKTTLFKVIAGIIKPQSGLIRVHGHRPGSHICVAYLPQQNQVDLRFPVTVSEVVMMGRIREIGMFRWPRRKDWEIVDRALGRVGMLDQRSVHIGQLSTGEQQRTFLAQAIAQEAEIVLLDEPLAGLDVLSKDAILDILDDLKAHRVTVLVAMHDLSLASDRFEKVMLLNKVLIACGSPSEAFSPELLVEAYGGHLHLVQDGDQIRVLADTHRDGMA
jgi:ABC-type Mn2+/Zn2+ transport system ATPase subunit